MPFENVDSWFMKLDKALQKKNLDDGNGQERKASAREFFLVGRKSKSAVFKHVYSGNYIHLDPQGRLRFPDGDSPYYGRDFPGA